jgi:hypothetical protein
VTLLSPNGVRRQPNLYVIIFKDRRVGRCFNVSPLRTRAFDADDLAEKIWYHIAPCVVSGTADIQVDLTSRSGAIYEGIVTIAKFDVVEVGRASR